RLVPTAGGGPPSRTLPLCSGEGRVGGEGQSRNTPRVSSDPYYLLTVGRVPRLECGVTSCNQSLSSGSKDSPADPRYVTTSLPEFFARRRIVNVNGASELLSDANHGHRLAVRR